MWECELPMTCKTYDQRWRGFGQGAIMALVACLFGGTSVVAQDAPTHDCVIDPALFVSVASPESGLLTDVPFRRGDLVAKGDVVARLDSRVEETSVDLFAERAANQAEIEAQAARLSLSKSRRDRLQKLVERNVGSGVDLETAEAEVLVAEREVTMAAMRARVAELEYERARQVLARRTILAPTDGVVVRRLLSAGEHADPDNPILQIAKLNPLHVEAFLPISEYGKVELGDEATVFPAPPIKGAHNGTVIAVDRVFDAASGTFGVRISLENRNFELPAGLRCRVAF